MISALLRDPDTVLFSRYNVFARNFYLVCRPDNNVKIYQLVRLAQRAFTSVLLAALD